jgi:hypothetical protein
MSPVFPSAPARCVAIGSRRSSTPPGPARDGVLTRRPAISPTTSPIKPASWSYAEAHVVEDDVLAAARSRAEEVGVVPIGSGGGAALRFLASVLEARAVVEIGTGTGVSGIWLLRGMRPDGVLTTVDIEAEHQRLAKQSWSSTTHCGTTGSPTRPSATRTP